MKVVPYFGEHTIKIVGNSFKVSNQNDLYCFYNLIKGIKDCRILDIEANKGYYSLLSTLKKDFYFYAFEPIETVFKRYLVKNLILNDVVDRGQAFCFGLSNEEEYATLWYDNTENATLQKDEEKAFFMESQRKKYPHRARFFTYKSCSVHLRRLDDVSYVFVDQIHVVKIDVEGAEKLVIEGGLSFFKQHKPILFVEIEDRHCKRFGNTTGDVISYIQRNLGYSQVKQQNNNFIFS